MKYFKKNMSAFDIQDLLNFPQALACCKKCLSISPAMKRNWQQQIYCPTCGVQYVVHGGSEFERFRAYFRNKGLYIQNENIFEHCRQLAAIAHRVNQHDPNYSPLTGLLQALAQGRQFIHFITFGISKDFLLVLKFIAQQVKVRGVIAITPDQEWILSEIKDYELESPNLCIKTICTSRANWDDLPHQKLVVIDGLIAFKGSANLTTTAWRKAARFYDAIEVVTQITEVIDCHNRYFSSIWATQSEHSDTITIDTDHLDDSVA